MTIWNHGRKNIIQVIFPRQFFRIKSTKIKKNLPLKGILRKILFGKFGFGEFQVYNWNKQDELANN